MILRFLLFLSIVSLASAQVTVGNYAILKKDVSGGTFTYTDIGAALPALITANTFTATQTITPSTANTAELILSGSSITGSGTTGFMTIAGTWNTSGSPTALDINVTNTASGGSSLLQNWRIGGNSFASISKFGFLILGPASGSQLSTLMQINGQFGQVNLAQGGNANVVSNVSWSTMGRLQAEYVGASGGTEIDYIGAHAVSGLPNMAGIYAFGVCTDATSISVLGAGGGSTVVAVFNNGSGWQIIPSFPASVTADLVAQSATVASVATVTAPNDGAAHQYSVGAYTAITAISAGTLTISITFTDENSASRTVTYFPMGLTSAGLTSTGFTAFSPATIRAKANTSVTVVATFIGVSVTYDVGANITRLN